jgi:hypothetical protein
MVVAQHLPAERQALLETGLRRGQIPLPAGEPPLIVESVGQRFSPLAARPAGDGGSLVETGGGAAQVPGLGGHQAEAVEVLGQRQAARPMELAVGGDRPLVELARRRAVAALPGHVAEEGEEASGLALVPLA